MSPNRARRDSTILGDVSKNASTAGAPVPVLREIRRAYSQVKRDGSTQCSITIRESNITLTQERKVCASDRAGSRFEVAEAAASAYRSRKILDGPIQRLYIRHQRAAASNQNPSGECRLNRLVRDPTDKLPTIFHSSFIWGIVNTERGLRNLWEQRDVCRNRCKATPVFIGNQGILLEDFAVGDLSK